MKSNLIAEKDFDVYKIPMPFRFMRKKKRESFLNGELEKLHPRFSAKNFFDAKYSIEKGRVVANVAVMNRLIFAKYKNNSGGKLLLLSGNGIKTRPIFTAKEKKLKTIGMFSILLFFGGALLIFGFYFLNKKGGLYDDGKNILEKTDLGQEENLAQETAFKAQSARSIAKCEKIFQSVLETGGLVTNFSASENQAIFKLKNCYPEKIFGSENCTVSYQNGKPAFEVRISDGLLAAVNSPNGERQLLGEGDFLSSVREKIFECGGCVVSELLKEENASITFEIGFDKIKNLLNEIRTLEIKKNWCEKSIDLTVVQDGKESSSGRKAAFNLEFLPFYSDESFLSLVSQFNEVFIEKLQNFGTTQPALARQTKKIRSVGEIAATTSSLQEHKIGAIRGADGKKFYYIRGNDGKIRKEVLGD